MRIQNLLLDPSVSGSQKLCRKLLKRGSAAKDGHHAKKTDVSGSAMRYHMWIWTRRGLGIRMFCH